jgi:DnaK suppressor protein
MRRIGSRLVKEIRRFDHNDRSRNATLRAILSSHYDDVLRQLRGRVGEARGGTADDRDVASHGEVTDADVSCDMVTALAELSSNTLTQIALALQRLEEGTYGCCRECGHQIAEPRLRAIPFATRCRECQDRYETTQMGDRIARRGGSFICE